MSVMIGGDRTPCFWVRLNQAHGNIPPPSLHFSPSGLWGGVAGAAAQARLPSPRGGVSRRSQASRGTRKAELSNHFRLSLFFNHMELMSVFLRQT